MYEGVSRASNPGYGMIEKYGVTVFTPLNSDSGRLKMGEHLPRRNLSSLRLLGTVGEPINPAWMVLSRDWG